MRVGLPAFKTWEIDDILKSRGRYAPATTKHDRNTNSNSKTTPSLSLPLNPPTLAQNPNFFCANAVPVATDNDTAVESAVLIQSINQSTKHASLEWSK